MGHFNALSWSTECEKSIVGDIEVMFITSIKKAQSLGPAMQAVPDDIYMKFCTKR